MAELLALVATHSVAAAPPITALAVAPDGNYVVVGSQSGVIVRSLPSLDVVRTLDTQLSSIHDIVFSPDATRVVLVGGTSGESGGFELRNWPTSQLALQRLDFDDVAYAGDWSTDGELAIAGEQRVMVYRGADFANAQVLAGHSRRVLAVQFVPESDSVVSAGADQSLRVFQREDGNSLRVLQNHTADVYDLAIRPGEAQPPIIASCGADRTVRFWQPTIGRLVRFVRFDQAEPLSLAWTPDGTQIVAACTDGQLRIIDPQTADVRAVIPACDEWAYEVAIIRHGRAIVGGANGELQLVQLSLPSAEP
jgi:WD40 repeat protein